MLMNIMAIKSDSGSNLAAEQMMQDTIKHRIRKARLKIKCIQYGFSYNCGQLANYNMSKIKLTQLFQVEKIRKIVLKLIRDFLVQELFEVSCISKSRLVSRMVRII